MVFAALDHRLISGSPSGCNENAAIRDALQTAKAKIRLLGLWIEATGLWSKRPIDDQATPAKSADNLETQGEDDVRTEGMKADDPEFRPFDININAVDHTMKRSVQGDVATAEFSTVRTSDPWLFAKKLIEADGQPVEFKLEAVGLLSKGR